MISHVIFFLVLSSLGALCAASSTAPSRRRFEEYLPVSCSGIVLILFGFGLAEALKTGVYFICALSALFYLAAVVTVVRRKSYYNFCQSFFSPGFFIFGLLFVGLTFLNNDRMAWAHDEFSHWADVVKSMFLIDDFSTSKLSHSLFQSYPPGMALFQYFLQKIHQMVDSYSGFSEWRLYFCYQIFACSFLFPFLRHASLKQSAYTLLTFGVASLSPMILLGYYYPRMIMIDPFVGIVAGSGFALLYISKQKDILDYVQLSLITMILVLAKDVGLIFAVILACAAILEELIILRRGKKEYLRKRILSIAGMGSMLLSVAVPKLLWNWNIAARNAQKEFSQPIKLDILLDIATGKGEQFYYDVINSYIKKFFTGTQTLGIFEIPLTWPVVLMILTVVLCAIHWACQRRERDESKIFTVLLPIFQIVIYAVGLLVLYLFRYSEYEARNLASFDRYLAIPFQALLIMCVLIAFDYIHRFSDGFCHMGAIMISLILLTLPVDHVQEFFNRWSVESSIMRREVYEGISSHMLDITQNEQKKVYIISQESNGTDYYMLRYCIRPCISSPGAYSISPDGALYEGDIWTTQKTAEQWQEDLKNYDYALLFKLDDDFLKNYGSVFSNVEEVVEYTIFEVDHNTGLLSRCQ